jgi:tetratricopeptide (TPR) repeat protein
MTRPLTEPKRAVRPRPTRALAGLLALAVIGASGAYSARHVAAWYHSWAAGRALVRGDFREEYRHRAASLRVWADSAQAYFLAARAARRAGDLANAEKLLARCAELKWVPDAVHQEQLLLRLQRGDQHLDPAELLGCARAMDDCQPELPQVLEAATRAYLRDYRLLEVQECLTFWLEREPNNVQALLYRGWVLDTLLQPEASEADYRHVLALEPENDQARLRLAEALARAKRPEEALACYRALQLRQPANPAVVLGLAQCRRDMGDLTDARALLDRLLEPERLRLTRDLAASLREGRAPGREITAAAWYQQAVAVAPYDLRGQPQYVVSLMLRALVERAKLAQEQDQDARAEEWLRLALDLDPYDYQAVGQLAQCLERRSRTLEARACRARLDKLRADQQRLLELTRNIMDKPHEPALRWEAGIILLRNGQPRDGLRWLYSALGENPRYRPAHEALARHFESVHQADRAAYHRKQALLGKDEGGRMKDE